MKVVLIGDPGVGKTTIMTHLVNGNLDSGFVKSTEWNTFALEMKTREGKEEITITALELAEDDPRRTELFTESDVFILVYSIADMETFNNLKPVRDAILAAKNVTAIPLILAGNKVDLEEQRQVNNFDGTGLAESWNAPLVEFSAFNHANVVDLLNQAVEGIQPAAKEAHESKVDNKNSKKCCTIL